MEVRDQREERSMLAGFCHKVAKEGLVKCSSGNASFRVERNRMLVTASGTWLSWTNPDLVECDIKPYKAPDKRSLVNDGDGFGYPATPSSEARAHAGILAARKDLNVVLHFQSPYATVVAATPENLSFRSYNCIPEVPYYIGEIGVVTGFMVPGSKELADVLTRMFRDGRNLVLLAGHGVFTAGGDFDETLQRAVFFEMACMVKVHAAAMRDGVIDVGSDWVTKINKGSYGNRKR